MCCPFLYPGLLSGNFQGFNVVRSKFLIWIHVGRPIYIICNVTKNSISLCPPIKMLIICTYIRDEFSCTLSSRFNGMNQAKSSCLASCRWEHVTDLWELVCSTTNKFKCAGKSPRDHLCQMYLCPDAMPTRLGFFAKSNMGLRLWSSNRGERQWDKIHFLHCTYVYFALSPLYPLSIRPTHSTHMSTWIRLMGCTLEMRGYFLKISIHTWPYTAWIPMGLAHDSLQECPEMYRKIDRLSMSCSVSFPRNSRQAQLLGWFSTLHGGTHWSTVEYHGDECTAFCIL